MRAERLLFVALVMGSGCSFAARSPEAYRDDTGKVLATKSEAIRACYDGVLKSNPTAQGKVTVKFTVGDQGKLVGIAVDKTNTTAPDALGECVTKGIDGLALAPPDRRKGDGTWEYEFTATKPAQ